MFQLTSLFFDKCYQRSSPKKRLREMSSPFFLVCFNSLPFLSFLSITAFLNPLKAFFSFTWQKSFSCHTSHHFLHYSLVTQDNRSVAFHANSSSHVLTSSSWQRIWESKKVLEGRKIHLNYITSVVEQTEQYGRFGQPSLHLRDWQKCAHAFVWLVLYACITCACVHVWAEEWAGESSGAT